MTFLGLTLPTFVDDPDLLVEVAAAAEEHGLDGVFTFDHHYRIGSGGSEPALALEPVLGMLAAETGSVKFGPLVARASTRHPRVLRAALDSVDRIAPARLVAAVGAGDRLSAAEQESFGLADPGADHRVALLAATLDELRGSPYPVWAGGTSGAVVDTAGRLADAWNAWGVPVERFSTLAARFRGAVGAAGRDDAATAVTWGGLVELRPERWAEASSRSDVVSGPFDAMADALAAYVRAGASWLVLAPLDPGDPANPAVIESELRPRLAERLQA